MVEAFEPVVVGDAEVSALTGRTYTSRDAVHSAIFAFFMDQVKGMTAQGDEADIGQMNLLLDRAEEFAENNGTGDASLASMRFLLAQQRVGMAELGLHKAYQKALPIYQEALKAGLADGAMLEAKVETMQKALGLVPEVAPEGPAQQTEVSPTEEEAGKEAAITAPPERVAKETKAPAVAEEPTNEAKAPAVAEEPAKEAEAAVALGVEAEETQIPAEVESSVAEGETVSAETETDATVEQTNPGEETDTPTSFMQWLKSKQQ
jgi:hypothetical protein